MRRTPSSLRACRTAVLFAGLAIGPCMTARGDVIYGISFSGQLISIDPSTGAGTLLATLPSIGNSGWDGLERDPAGGLLAIRDHRELVHIDLTTFAVTPRGSLISQFWFAESLALDSATGTMYCAGSLDNAAAAERLGRIDHAVLPATVSTVGVFGNGCDDVDGLAFRLSNGRLYAADATDRALYSVVPSTGAATLIGSLSMGTTGNALVTGLDFGSDETLWGVTYTNLSGGASNLVQIDPATGQTTIVGPTGFNAISGLVVVPSPAAGVLLLTALGVFKTQRRRS